MKRTALFLCQIFIGSLDLMYISWRLEPGTQHPEHSLPRKKNPTPVPGWPHPVWPEPDTLVPGYKTNGTPPSTVLCKSWVFLWQKHPSHGPPFSYGGGSHSWAQCAWGGGLPWLCWPFGSRDWPSSEEAISPSCLSVYPVMSVHQHHQTEIDAELLVHPILPEQAVLFVSVLQFMSLPWTVIIFHEMYAYSIFYTRISSLYVLHIFRETPIAMAECLVNFTV